MKLKHVIAWLIAVIASATIGYSYDLSSAFLAKTNPSGPWSFGSQLTLNGSLSLFTVHDAVNDASGGIWEYWYFQPSVPPSIYRNSGTGVLRSDSGQGTFPPGTVWFGPGGGGDPGFCVVRFTVPQGESGYYLVSIDARPYLVGPSARDADFHVSLNGQEIYQALILPGSGAGFTNQVFAAVGDTIDLIVGRGSDNSPGGGSVKISATVERQAGVVLNAGDSFDWHFSSLSDTQHYAGLSIPELGGVSMAMNAAGFLPGTRLRLEMFEGDTAEEPIESRVFATPTNLVRLARESVWADQEGAVRVTVDEGSARVSSLVVYFEQVRDGFVTEHRSSIVLSPAPPFLAASPAAGGVELKWSNDAPLATDLLTADHLETSDWIPFLRLLARPGAGRQQHHVTVKATNSSRFFRLSQ